MPELPEVETVRRLLAPSLIGRPVTSAGSHGSQRFSAAADVTGATIRGLTRRGKYLLAELDDGRELVLHLGMTGRLQLRARDAEPTGSHIRAWWELAEEVLELDDARRFGRVAVVERGEYRKLPTLAALGPEPLEPEFTAESLWESLRRSSRRVKTQLLSQRPVAGMGNIYADEALWRSGINPSLRRLSRRRAAELHTAIVQVLTEAIAHRGTTLRDFRDPDGRPGENQFRLDCYGRAGHPCRRCGVTLIRRCIDGRGTTSCPSCQAP